MERERLGSGTEIAIQARVPHIAAGLWQFLRMSTERDEVISAMPIMNYRDLEAWQAAFDLCLLVYDAAADLPQSERYELSGQLRRAAVSVPSNVAEGHARRKPKVFMNHVTIALGSVAELETCMMIALKREYVSEKRFQTTMDAALRSKQLLYGLARSIKRQAALENSATALVLATVATCVGFFL